MKNTIKNFLIVIFILFLGFLSFNFVYPQFLNLNFIPKIDFKLGLDLQGGVHLIYQADLSKISSSDQSGVMEGLRDVIERRINFFGVKEPLVQVQGDRLIVELAGVMDPAQAIQLIGQTPFLEFREERSEEETQKILEKQKELQGKDVKDFNQVENWSLAFEDPYFKPTDLTGRYLQKAEVVFDNFGKPAISINFNSEGEKIFEELTKNNIGKRLAIYIDGVLREAPVVQEVIYGGKAQITGNFTIKEAQELARNLNVGALPVPISLMSQQLVGPTLGTISLQQSLKAAIFGFLFVAIFMIVFYRLPGLLADIALLIYVLIMLSIFKVIPVTLTLAGIGGFILSIGMAVDANILIFSRMREELRDGKNFSIALIEGFRRAWPSIRDGNLTTLLVGIILFYFGTSFVKGFAFVLILGVLVSMLSAIVVTRYFLLVFENSRLSKIKWLW